MKVYGITNCNTVKKGIEWLKQNKLEFEFHDYKKKGISREKLADWIKTFGWENLINKKGTTWRKLSPEEQQKVVDADSAIALMMEKPSVIKRPIIETEGKLLIGFDEEEYKSNL